MSWYLARRLMACRVAGKLSDFEETFFVVQASSLTQARERARRLSKADEGTYKNVYQQTVSWRFHKLLDVTDLAVERLTDGTWLFARSFPGTSQLARRSNDHVSVNGRIVKRQRARQWFGVMLFFSTCQPPKHDEERLLLVRASDHEEAAQRALVLGKRWAEANGRQVVGIFQAEDLFDSEIVSGTQVYWRFHRPSHVKGVAYLPRECHVTVAHFPSPRAARRASA